MSEWSVASVTKVPFQGMHHWSGWESLGLFEKEVEWVLDQE